MKTIKSKKEKVMKIDLKKKELFKWVAEIYGKRCKEFMKGCACCEAWVLYDRLIQDKPLIQESKEEKK